MRQRYCIYHGAEIMRIRQCTWEQTVGQCDPNAGKCSSSGIIQSRVYENAAEQMSQNQNQTPKWTVEKMMSKNNPLYPCLMWLKSKWSETICRLVDRWIRNLVKMSCPSFDFPTVLHWTGLLHHEEGNSPYYHFIQVFLIICPDNAWLHAASCDVRSFPAISPAYWSPTAIETPPTSMHQKCHKK